MSSAVESEPGEPGFPLRVGIVTPVIQVNPRFDAPSWEETGTIEDVVAVAREADRLGYGWVAASEHVAIPVASAARRGPRYWDPVATLSYLAAHTERIGLLSHVLVLGYHHPLEIVKSWGTLDVISEGRVILGVGVGSLQEEFELLGREFAARGDVADDAIAAIRASWGQRSPRYEGPHFAFSDFIVEPSGLSRRLEIWIGGRTRRSLRRALAVGDGWIPFQLKLGDLDQIFADAEIRELMEAREAPLELILRPEPPIDPAGDPSGTADVLRRFQRSGATGLSIRFKSDSHSHYLEQVAALPDVLHTM